MAIFKKEKNIKSDEIKKDQLAKVLKNKESDAKPDTKIQTIAISRMSGNFESILKRPRITEKASVLAEQNTYVFEIDKRANKSLVKMAVKELYKVNPIKINIINSPSKAMVSKGIKGRKPGKKKAIVYLKKGDTIEVI